MSELPEHNCLHSAFTEFNSIQVSSLDISEAFLIYSYLLPKFCLLSNSGSSAKETSSLPSSFSVFL